MKNTINLAMCAGFVAISLFFLALDYFTGFHIFLHLAAVPLEVILAVFVVERFLERRAAQEKRRQLMFIKSCLFRSELRNLFLTNFEALASPAMTMSDIHAASLDELKHMRREAEHVEYASLALMEPAILEYVKARDVWIDFMNRAITYDFEKIFYDMIALLHFVSDVSTCKENHPDRLYMERAEENPKMKARAREVLGDGVRSFLDYAIELKERHPDMFDDMMTDYEFSAGLRCSAAACPQASPE